MSTQEAPPTLDPVAARRWQRIAPASSPWLHEEVARRMLDRLQWIKLQPQAWLHWEAMRGGLLAQAELTRRYPAAAARVIECTHARRQAAVQALQRPWWKRGWGQNPQVLEKAEPASVDMLWANMALHNAAEPQSLLAAWHALLRTDGFLMFSCLGPDTARELRGVYAQLGWPPAGHEFTDMHDWGDMLVQTGFAEPVMDMERITLTFDKPARLVHELVELGRNLHPQRFPALRGRAWRATLEAAIEEHVPRQADGRLLLTFEVIYGHALKPLPKVKLSPLSSVSVEDLRSMLQGSRPKP
ncbi:MAG: biotin synthase [Pseudomonadota bacterium]